MPLQASTILLRLDQRRAALNPPLPPISHKEVQHGELVTLLTEEDYNLLTMVNLKFHFYYFALKITSLIPSNFLFVLSVILTLCLLYGLIYCLVLHSHMGYYTPSYVFCVKYLHIFSCIILEYINYFTLLSILLKYFLSIRIINLDLTFIFSGVPLKKSMPELCRHPYQTQPLTSGKP